MTPKDWLVALIAAGVKLWRKRKARKATEQRHRDEKAKGKPHNESRDK